MKRTHTTMAVTLAAMMPTVLMAQETTPTATRTSAAVNAEAQTAAQLSVPASFSAEGRKSLSALYADASKRGFSTTSMANLVAEGQAKGASETSIVKAASAKHAQLVATHEAMIRAGRTSPSSEEVDRGANLMARGATAAQIEALTRKAPAERSLTVAFEVLTDLSAKGMPVGNALAQVQTKLEQRATDASIRELGVNLGLGLGAQSRSGVGNGAASASGAAAGSATAGATKPATPTRGLGATVGGTVTGAVGGVIRKP